MMRNLLCTLLALALSLCCHAGGQTVLRVPRERLEKPLLFGSRIVKVNRPYGKVFADGQRNPQPQLVQFVREGQENSLQLRPVHYRTPDGMEILMHGKKGRNFFPPVRFAIVEETPDTLTVDVSDYFSTYPEAVSAIPPKMLRGRATAHEILSVSETDSYLQVTGRYEYDDRLEVTAACYLIFLREPPMAARQVDPEKAGYNGVEFRTRDGRRTTLSHRWNIEPGRQIPFYIDKAFPAEWVPYIREGIEDWNRCFESIGLGSVFRVLTEPEDGSLDRNSPLVNMVRYMDVEESNAKGDVLVDPRSGEILQGDILWWKNVTQLLCNWRYVQTGAADPQARLPEYPVEMLGPMIRHAVCHEMGHVLGLSHNMGASYAYPADSLRSVSFTRLYGTCASVMDYARYNHLATAADVAAGVNLLPPRVGPYDEYAIALGYGQEGSVLPGEYCYFAPFISAAISPDPSAQAETLGDDLLRSSKAGVANCRALLGLDGLDESRTELLRSSYYRYIFLSLSNIGGAVSGIPVSRKVRRATLRFVMESLARVPEPLFDARQQDRILSELTGNFLPVRLRENGGEREWKDYSRQLARLQKKYHINPHNHHVKKQPH